MGMLGYLKDQEKISSQDPRMLKIEHLTYLRACAQKRKNKQQQKQKFNQISRGN